MSLLDDVKDLPPKAWSNKGMLPQVTRQVQALAPRARQFVFDEGASRLVGEFIRDCPDILVDQMQFARQPYDTTYIEVDIDAMYQTMGIRKIYTGERDWKVGFLAHGGTIYAITNSRERPVAHLSPTCTFDYEYRPVAADPLSDDSKVLLGSTWNVLSDAQRDAFAQRFNVGFLASHEFDRDKALEIMLPAIAGEARVYVACLLFLYQKHRLTLIDQVPRRALSKGRQRVYMAHTTVTIHLSQYTDLRRDLSVGFDRSAPRRHEVRTHYKHRQMTAGCEHQWVRVEDAENEQWRCTGCSGLRWLCRQHLRGDGAIGFVTKHYEVKV
jgi:hypothetical protein